MNENISIELNEKKYENMYRKYYLWWWGNSQLTIKTLQQQIRE